MSKVIRIGTRDSELALWQANAVKDMLESLGHQTVLVPVKSAGDLVVQAAVLERSNFLDILAYNNNEEFLGQPEGVIATGSLRRKAQWLNRYPTHTIVDLRGNINSRMQKLNDSDWNGAIFAAAGLERIGLEHENTLGLTWMVPAPAQGAIMVAAMEADEEIRKICGELNHERTEICVTQEREFLRLLEGGCTAPIGGLCYINNDDKVVLKGVLLTVDGSKKLEAEVSAPLGEHENLGRDCANSILARGGKRLMSDLFELEQRPTVFSTKKLTSEQKQLFDKRMKVDSHDFIKIYSNRISAADLKNEIQNVIITSKNAVEALADSIDTASLKFKNIYCVGRRTKKLIESRIGKVTHVASSAKALAEHLLEHMEGGEITYFCSNIRLNELPNILTENNIKLNEVVTYETKYAAIKIPDSVKRVLFFSPSGVESFASKNTPNKKAAYCIGETTASEARKHFETVHVAKIPTIESVIELLKT